MAEANAPIPSAHPASRGPGALRLTAQARCPARGAPPGVRATYKRPFDLSVTALAVVALLPLWAVLVGTIAAAIRFQDGGAVLYSQPRLGRDGRVFRILKFRTMAEGAERATGPVWARRRDVRATPVGRVLRRLHLDELPQLLNVLRGEMSLVGPRPERPAIAARIQRKHPNFARRLAVRPGIAGLAQSRGRFRLPPPNKLRYDLLYIGAMGPWLDLKLLCVCVWRALRGPPPSRRMRSPRTVRRLRTRSRATRPRATHTRATGPGGPAHGARQPPGAPG